VDQLVALSLYGTSFYILMKSINSMLLLFSMSLSINIVERKHSWHTIVAYPVWPSLRLCVCVSGKCTVVKRMTGSRFCYGWRVGLIEGWVY